MAITPEPNSETRCINKRFRQIAVVIVHQKGRLARLAFTGQRSATYSEQQLFPDFNKNAALPEGQPVTLELTPEKLGEYGFQCQMERLRGKLIVEE